MFSENGFWSTFSEIKKNRSYGRNMNKNFIEERNILFILNNLI